MIGDSETQTKPKSPLPSTSYDLSSNFFFYRLCNNDVIHVAVLQFGFFFRSKPSLSPLQVGPANAMQMQAAAHIHYARQAHPLCLCDLGPAHQTLFLGIDNWAVGWWVYRIPK
jgi:hypothetical protein